MQIHHANTLSTIVLGSRLSFYCDTFSITPSSVRDRRKFQRSVRGAAKSSEHDLYRSELAGRGPLWGAARRGTRGARSRGPPAGCARRGLRRPRVPSLPMRNDTTKPHLVHYSLYDVSMAVICIRKASLDTRTQNSSAYLIEPTHPCTLWRLCTSATLAKVVHKTLFFFNNTETSNATVIAVLLFML